MLLRSLRRDDCPCQPRHRYSEKNVFWSFGSYVHAYTCCKRKAGDIINTQEVTLSLSESLYLRFKQTAQAPQQSHLEVLLHVVQVGSPPSWGDAPVAFEADVAALDRVDDEAL